jgi:hypothetical protein
MKNASKGFQNNSRPFLIRINLKTHLKSVTRPAVCEFSAEIIPEIPEYLNFMKNPEIQRKQIKPQKTGPHRCPVLPFLRSPHTKHPPEIRRL